MKFLINGTLEGQSFEMEIEGEDREDAIVELNHSVICLDGKPLTKFPKFDLRTLRKAPEGEAEVAAAAEEELETAAQSDAA